MLTVGIYAKDSVWEENLSAFSQGAPFQVSGRIGDCSLDQFAASTSVANSDVLWIPQKTDHSIQAAIHSLRHSRHVLLGFPVVDFQNEANLLVNLAREAHVDVQVGHHDRYHPAFRSIQDCLHHPQFIQIQQDIAGYPDPTRSEYLTPILHNVDAVLALVKEPLKKVHAHKSVLSALGGISIHIRLQFHNGTVANLVIRQMGFPEKRALEVVDYEQFFSMDLLLGESWRYRLENQQQIKEALWPVGHLLGIQSGKVDEESVTRECVSFFQRKANNRKPLASIEEGYEALQITEMILKKIGEVAR